MLDLGRVLGGKRKILVGVALGVNDDCRASHLISNEVGGVRQARQIELFKYHMLHFRVQFFPPAGERCVDRAGEPSNRPDTFCGLRRPKRCR